jgi:hypothetical protein
MRSPALSTGATVGTGTIRRMVAAVRRGLGRMASGRRRTTRSLDQQDLAGPLAAGMSRGLTLLVPDPSQGRRRSGMR